jgi:hypothetical protein
MKITLFHKPASDGVATKTIALDGNGKPCADGSACRMTQGYARGGDVGLQMLANMVTRCSPQTALCAGALNAAALARANSKGIIAVTTKHKLAAHPNAIARSRDFLEFTPGVSAPMVLDFDQKGMPPSVKDRLTAAGGFWPLMVEAFPPLANVARVERASTSSGLYRSDTGECFSDSGGVHVYLEARDGSDIPRALKAAFQRLWLADAGWISVSENGSALIRSPVDGSVGMPERLFFEGPPQLSPPLRQDAKTREAVFHAGTVLDTQVCFPSLSAIEDAEYERKVEAAKAAVETNVRIAREKANATVAQEIAARTGDPYASALKVAQRRFDFELAPEIVLHFDDPTIGSVSVSEVLADPEAFLDETLADPIEPNYGGGTCKAKVLRGNRNGHILIHSFAHGSHVYRLLHNEKSIHTIIERTKKIDAVGVFFACLEASTEPEVIFERLKGFVSTHAGVRISALNAERVQHEKCRRREQARRKNAEAHRKDNRPRLPCPVKGAEKLTAVAPIDNILAKVNCSRPPLRNLSGNLVRVEEKSQATLHELISETEVAALQAAGKEPLPAPKEILFKILTPTGVSMMCEEHIGLYVLNDSGEESLVSLPPEFSVALMEMPGSQIPVCSAIQTLPLVLPGRRLLCEQGYNAERRLLMQIEPALFKVMPTPDECTLASARAAYAFLCKEWLCDVQTDKAGLATIIATALQMIERVLLDQRPNIFINGSMSGGGKTTLANMLTSAVYGRRAAAAAWTDNKEERKKSLFSWLLEGVACVVFDNIKRGERINCEVLDKIATSFEYTDRVLGSTKTGTASACTTFILTGNCISPRGDARNRSLVINIASSTAKPEARYFKHQDVIGWTIGNRSDILRALYIILLVDRPDISIATRTRFKSWYQLCARPVEIVSGIDLVAIFEHNDEADDETNGVTYLFERLYAAFGQNVFRAKDVGDIMNPDYGIDDPFSSDAATTREHRREDAERLREALDTAMGRTLPLGAPVSQIGRWLSGLKDYIVSTESGTLRLSMLADAKHGATYRILAGDATAEPLSRMTPRPAAIR